MIILFYFSTIYQILIPFSFFIKKKTNFIY